MEESKSHLAPENPSADPSLQTETIRALLRVMRRHHACIERQLGDLGIHPAQHRMLMQLAKREQIPSQRELAERMGISPAAVANTLKKLEKDGYIIRAVTDDDNRCNEIRITDLGRAKVAESREIFESVDHAMFEGLSDQELSTLSALLLRLDQNLDCLGVPDPCCRRRTN